jgi:protein-disulfide isomerase
VPASVKRVFRPLAALALAALAAVAAATVIPRRFAEAGPSAVPAAVRALSVDQRTELERWYESLPRVSLPVAADGAAVLVVKFTDFQCPGCAATHFGYAPVISKYQARYPGAVRIVELDYPLQPDCNAEVRRPIHSAACDAAVAVRLAARQGKAQAVAEWFYANQAMMSPAAVREVAAGVGGVRDFAAGYESAVVGIRRDVALATALGVSGTPTFFVNGVRLPSAPSLPAPEQFDAIVAYELKRAGLGGRASSGS